MTAPIMTIHNATTGETIQRPMTELEVEDLELSLLQDEAREQEKLEKAEARSAAEAKLLALGLTTDDLKALLG